MQKLPVTTAVQVTLDDDYGSPASASLCGLLRDELSAVLGERPRLPDGGRLATVTGSYVVDPPFYGSGDVGHLAVCSAVNELAATGATPLGVALSAVVEAGLPLERLRRLAGSVREAAEDAGVPVLAVDARVVRAGETDQVYLQATGVGVHTGAPLDAADARPGDQIVVSGRIGGHGAHLLSAREGLGYESIVHDDCAPLADLLAVVRAGAPSGAVRAARHVSRGGLVSALHAYAGGTGLEMRVDEGALPVQYEARLVLDAVGVAPVQAPSEGCLCLLVGAGETGPVLAALRGHRRGRHAAVVGEVLGRPDGAPVRMVTPASGVVPLLPEPVPARLA